jgi:2-octaprenylphenol hydroxylase
MVKGAAVKSEYDVVIVGAGIVGLTAALGIAKIATKQALCVAVIDRNVAPQIAHQYEYSSRVSAISRASTSLLQSIGAWQHIPRKQAYEIMHVWDTDGFGDIKFDGKSATDVEQIILQSPKIAELESSLLAKSHDSSVLGHIIENDVINHTLYEQLASLANVDLLFETTIKEMSADNNSAQISVSQSDTISTLKTSLLIGADGANSQVRQAFGFVQTFWDYEHNAIVANVNTELAHNNTARQVFTPYGPLAFLPLPDAHQSSIVFSQQSEQAAMLMKLDDAEFNKRLQVAINNHYGKVDINSTRVSFPLRMRYARQWTQAHVAIIGDAAHTIHPLAGQGANLGLADVAELIELITNAPDKLGTYGQLRQYERTRKADAIKVIATMQGFKELFDGNHPLKKLVRNVGLLGADKLPGIKAFFMKQAMG